MVSWISSYWFTSLYSQIGRAAADDANAFAVFYVVHNHNGLKIHDQATLQYIEKVSIWAMDTVP